MARACDKNNIYPYIAYRHLPSCIGIISIEMYQINLMIYKIYNVFNLYGSTQILGIIFITKFIDANIK